MRTIGAAHATEVSPCVPVGLRSVPRTFVIQDIQMQRVVLLSRALVISVSVLVIAASLGVLTWFVFYEETAEKHTVGQRPALFWGRFEVTLLLDDYAGVFGVAHNSGDGLAATRRAIASGADVIEIDVISLDGELYAAHDQPVRRFGAYVFRGPRLRTVWAASEGADVIKLDLKESSPAFLELVVSFVNAHQHRQIIVSAREPSSLRVLAERAPQVFRVLSVATQAGLEELHEDAELIALIDGVTIRQSLLDESSAGWLRDHSLLILAWTVNDIKRVNELVALGVDGITTDNLTILELLGGQQRAEALLAHAADRRRIPISQ